MGMNYDKLLDELGYEKTHVAGRGMPNTFEGIVEFGKAVKKQTEEPLLKQISELRSAVDKAIHYAKKHRNKELFELLKWEKFSTDVQALKREVKHTHAFH